MKKKEYNQRELFGMLENISTVYVSEWALVCKIVSSMKDISVIEKKWEDWDYKNKNPEHYPLNLSKIETWSTYSDCIDLRFFIDENKKLICEFIIWNGSMLDGRKTKKRFSGKLLLPNKFIKELSYYINRKFQYFLEDEYEKYLSNKKILWIENMKKEFIETFNKK